MTSATVFKCRIAGICVLWYICSSANSIVNKLILQHYAYPITVALSNQMFIPLLAMPILRAWEVREVRPTTQQLRRYLLPIAVGRAIASGSAAFSLSLMPVSYTQTVKALMPLFAVLFGRVILGEHQTPIVYVSLLPIVLGVFIATVTELSFSAVGLVAALVSTSTYSLLNILVKKLLRHTDMHPIRLLALAAQLCAVVLFPVWLFKDAYTMLGDLMQWEPSSGRNAPDAHLLLMLGVSGCCSFAQNVCAFSLIHLLTALSYAVTNTTKRITVIVASLLTLHNPVSPTNVVGMLVAVLGVFCYNQAKQNQKVHDVIAADSASDGSSMAESRKHLLPLSEQMHTSLSDATLVALGSAHNSDMLYWATKSTSGIGGGSRLATVISGAGPPSHLKGRLAGGGYADDFNSSSTLEKRDIRRHRRYS